MSVPAPRRRPLLLRGACVLTLDPRIGTLARGDVRVEGERIAAVAPQLDAGDAELIDATGMVLMPGLVNAHMHTWQTALRGIAADWTILEYFRHMHAGLATRFTPEDIGIATLVGALNQIHCGTTTLGDWCHNNPTPAHTDAAVEALQSSGLRALFLHGSPKPDPKPGQRPFWEMPHPRSEVQRLRAGSLRDQQARVTLGLAILGPHYSTYEVAQHDFELAREFGLVASMHCAGAAARVPDGWQRLLAAGLMGPHVNIVHGNDLGDDELARLVESGVNFTATPETEMAQGHGFAITGRLRALGASPSLGVDLESSASGDLFTTARLALAAQRALDNDHSRRDQGALPPTTTVPAREALHWMTLGGARALGLDDRIGSLTPGKQADLLLLDPGISMRPIHDPVASVVTQAGVHNVDSVMIGGRWCKRQGRLLHGELGTLLDRLAESGQRLLAEHGRALAAQDKTKSIH